MWSGYLIWIPHQSLPVTLGGSSQEKTTGQIQDMLMGFKIESDSYPVRPNGHGGDQRLLGCLSLIFATMVGM